MKFSTRTPTIQEWHRLWDAAIKQEKQTNGNLVCVKHFHENDYVVKNGRFILNKNAVPSIFPVNNEKGASPRERSNS